MGLNDMSVFLVFVWMEDGIVMLESVKGMIEMTHHGMKRIDMRMMKR